MEKIFDTVLHALLGKLRQQTAGNVHYSRKKQEDFIALYSSDEHHHQVIEKGGYDKPIRYMQEGISGGDLEAFIVPLQKDLIIYSIFNGDRPVVAGCVGPKGLQEPPREWIKFSMIFESLRLSS